VLFRLLILIYISTRKGRHYIDILCDAESTSETQSQQSTPAPQGLQGLAKSTKPGGPVLSAHTLKGT
jgi:hypothetical protein